MSGCKVNIKKDLKGIGHEGTDWNCLLHDKDQWRALLNIIDEESLVHQSDY
jgi:hypothetical protein